MNANHFCQWQAFEAKISGRISGHNWKRAGKTLGGQTVEGDLGVALLLLVSPSGHKGVPVLPRLGPHFIDGLRMMTGRMLNLV